VDIHDIFKTDPNYRDGMAKLAEIIVDNSYKKMKKYPSGMQNHVFYVKILQLSYGTSIYWL
jgi:hypothetical protein